MPLSAAETTAVTTMLNDGWTKTACTLVVLVSRRLGVAVDTVRSDFETPGLDIHNLMVSLGTPATQDH